MKEKNILEFLERTVDRYPDQVAVDDGQIILTWKELKELSMRFGTAFSRTVKEGKPIVFLMVKKRNLSLRQCMERYMQDAFM